MSYITTSDITDSIKQGFESSLTAIILRSDDEAKSVALSMGVLDTEIVEPVHYDINQWLVNWVTMELCFEKIGKANEVERDKYQNKYELYMQRVSYYRNRLTDRMFRGTANDSLSVVPMSSQLLRG